MNTLVDDVRDILETVLEGPSIWRPVTWPMRRRPIACRAFRMSRSCTAYMKVSVKTYKQKRSKETVVITSVL